ncbi:MAG: hypothetical protein CVV64_20745 [Candidatus Wallbacteria bacterium HGW-Wallbacteria-1]|uniref:Uncharacterized protein n=1 Tax=Candidatus Wallbacteria bacterium HGW-Wallbacteria-1 TaxID=2013854 RepID=A0A2N1PI57_9BACT|nr:MAG: hypothetical protein CVV64_20745 [Candidatus Wallbacteria bacterium HGW-Wallbacteria-1]
MDTYYHDRTVGDFFPSPRGEVCNLLFPTLARESGAVSKLTFFAAQNSMDAVPNTQRRCIFFEQWVFSERALLGSTCVSKAWGSGGA